MSVIPVLTAGFGEGHNAAARSIIEALGRKPGLKGELHDLFLEGPADLVIEIISPGSMAESSRWQMRWRPSSVAGSCTTRENRAIAPSDAPSCSAPPRRWRRGASASSI